MNTKKKSTNRKKILSSSHLDQKNLPENTTTEEKINLILSLPEEVLYTSEILNMLFDTVETLEKPSENKKLEKTLLTAINKNTFLTSRLFRIISKHIKRKPITKESIFSEDVYKTLMKYGVVLGRDFEIGVYKTRLELFSEILKKGEYNADEEEKIFLIATQQFHKEYCMYVNGDERGALEKIKNLIEIKVKNNEDITPISLYLYLYSMYESLDTITGIEKTNIEKFPEPLKTIYYLNIESPESLKKISESIPQGTSISEGASEIVRSQYENNPYPRWQAVSYQELPDMDTYFTHILQTEKKPSPIPERPSILIAGCGTGQQPITLAQLLPFSRITAIDLSRNSLAYAKNKAIEHNAKNIDFYQADILRLSELNKTFDMIDCSGVLHHLGDPEQGLRCLLDVLNPGGVITINVYSTLARRELVKHQQEIIDQDIKPTLENIRKYRMKCFMEDNDRIISIMDFYSTSMCRDLIFHTHEKTYSWLEIQELMDRSNLKIISIIAEHQTHKDFRKAFPDKKDQHNTSSWNAYEEDNPDTFMSMLKFSATRI